MPCVASSFRSSKAGLFHVSFVAPAVGENLIYNVVYRSAPSTEKMFYNEPHYWQIIVNTKQKQRAERYRHVTGNCWTRSKFRINAHWVLVEITFQPRVNLKSHRCSL